MNMQDIYVVKRDGTSELLDLEKIHKVITWAAEGLDNVSVSLVELRANVQFYSGITTEDIHQTIIKSASDLISEESPDYQYLAARLNMFHLRKKAYGVFTPPSLLEQVTKLTALGVYDKGILESYTVNEIEELAAAIDHSRDLSFSYAAVKQMEGKYLAQNRVTGQIYESPQFMYMLISACLFSEYPKATRLGYVKQYYDACSLFKISLPTPIMAGVRTPTKQFSSCTKIEVDDSLDSINAGANAIVKYISQRAGIGINAGRIRALGSPIRNGEAFHTGCIPFYKHFQTAVKSCSQGGLRGGAATLFYPLWHLEVESLLVLKNNRGVEENRVRQLDYGVQLNKLMYERLIKGGNITLFSPSDVDGLYDAFFEDQDLFQTLYEKYENDPTIRKKVVKAADLFSSMMQERASTGRIYIQNVDHCNTHSAFNPEVAPVRQSNLCLVGSDRVVSSYGYLTAKELHDIGTELVLFSGTEPVKASQMKLREKDADVYKITLANGMEHTVTDYHGVPVLGDHGSITRVACKDLKIGDKVAVQTTKGLFGSKNMPEEAFLLGMYQSDGTQNKDTVMIDVWEKDFDLIEEIQNSFNRIHYSYGMDTYTVRNQTGECVGSRKLEPASFHECSTGVSTIRKQRLASKTLKKALNFEKGYVPDWIWEADEETQWNYVRGLLIADGTAFMSSSTGNPLQIAYTETDVSFLKELQLLFQNLGLQTSIHLSQKAGEALLPDGKGGTKYYQTKDCYRLVVGNKTDALAIEKHTGFLSRKGIKLEDRAYRDNTKKGYKVVSIDYAGKEDVYCPTVYNDENIFVAQGMRTFNCLEITLPTKPLNNILDDEGEIALCTLAAFNLGAIDTISAKEMAELSDLLVRSLDALLDYQDYPVPAAMKAGKKRRALGIGVINYAYALAKRGLKYSDGSANEWTHEIFEAIQYHLLKASNNLAKERGACEFFNETSYAQGLLPIDTYKKDVDSFCPPNYYQDWEQLRSDILKYGLRNSTLTALMPSESSSQVSNATNGIEPPRGYISIKQSKDGILKQVVPDFKTLKNSYELLWNIPSNKGYLELVAIMQKFVDQAISANTNYDPAKFPNGKVPMQQLLMDLLVAYKIGIKTLYYHNTRDGSSDPQDDDCGSGGCKI